MVAVAIRRGCVSVFSAVAMLLEHVCNFVMRDESNEEAPSGFVRSRKIRNEFSFESKLHKFYAVCIGFHL